MELLNNFRIFLLQEANAPSKVTIKNYLADVRKFISWFEKRFTRAFVPRLVTKEIVEEYTNQLVSLNSQSTISSARSIKRYLSSLRKFYHFLLATNVVISNPFSEEKNMQPPLADPWHIKHFANHLIELRASKPTIKNYLVDIRQFAHWLEKTTDSKSPLTTLNHNILEEYKSRLLYDAHFEPRSVNRKLSSLRKYLTWAQKQGLLAQAVSVTQAEISRQPQREEKIAIQTEETKQQEPSKDNYSAFPPFRVIQKLYRFSTYTTDLLLLWPVVKSALAIRHSLWKLSGKNVFTPIHMVEKQLSQTNVHQAAIDRFVTHHTAKDVMRVAQISKAMYAPLSISLTNFPTHKKILHHLKHTRPAWYKRYHAYPVVHYLHFGIALIYTTILGFTIYQAIAHAPLQSSALASLPASPPRMLAFSGTLTDASQTPITAEKTLRFGLYTDPTASASAMVWQETQQIQPDYNGNFETLLGKHRPIEQALLDDSLSLYLGIAIGNDEELRPRQQIATVTYSKEAETIQGLAPITNPAAGTANVLLALDSGGDLTIGGAASHRFEATGGEFTLAGKTLTLTTTEGSNTNIQLNPDGTGIVDIQKPIQNTSNYSSVSGLEGMVHIEDATAITAATSSQSALIINQNGSGNFISASSSGTAKFTVNGAGGGMFAGDLDVNGNSLNTSSTYFSLVDTNVINLRIGSFASAISIGSSYGETLINNNLKIQGATTLVGTTSAMKLFTANAGLFVRDDRAENAVAMIENTNTGNKASGLEIKLGNNAPGNENSFILFKSGDGTVLGEITGETGTTSATIKYKTNGADYAEYYKKANAKEHFAQGDLVCLAQTEGVTKCTGTNQPLLGVVSETAGFVGAGNHTNDPAYVLVGIVGQLPVKVAPNASTIASGDPLAVTATGVIKATNKTMIIGHALSPFDTKTGMVHTALSITTYDPSLAINELGDILPQEAQSPTLTEQLTNGIIENITLGIIEARHLSVASLDVATDNITIGGQTLQAYVRSIAEDTTRELENRLVTRTIISPVAEIAHVRTDVISPLSDDAEIAIKLEADKLSIRNSKFATGSAVASIDNQGNASFSGTLAAADASVSGTIRAGNIIADNIAGLDNKLATLAAGINQIASPASSPIPSPYTITPDQGILALGASSFTDVGIGGTLRLNETTILSENSINTIGTDLALQSFRQGNLSLMGNLVSIDTEGNLNVAGHANFAQDVAIQGTLQAREIAPLEESVVIKLGKTDDEKEQTFVVKDATNSAVLTINQAGDIIASGAGTFVNIAAQNFSIIRGAQADTSFTNTIANGSAGVGVISANERERTISSPYITPDSLVYITAASNTQGVTPYVTRQTATSFTVQIPQAVTKDIKFNWWIVN